MTVYDIELQNVVKDFPAQGGKPPFRAVNSINLQIKRGEFFALLGPSGCGKTTTLRMIAGFEQPTSGAVLIRGKAMQGVPPFHRPVNTVFQDYALFPHMTVLQNILFGLQMEGVPKKDAEKRAYEALELVRLPDIATRKPGQLSGGQQQRVALARALVKRPAVLLLDEPLGALDLKLRKQMQYELKAIQNEVGITFIYVTHDQEEALTMANRIAVMDGGNVLQVGDPKTIYEHPATHFVADFIGETNFIKGKLSRIEGVVGYVNVGEGLEIEATHESDVIGLGDVVVAVRPERIGLLPVDGDIPTLHKPQMNVLSGNIVDNSYIGTDTRYTVALDDGQHVVVRLQNVDYRETFAFEEGEGVKLFFPSRSATILT